MLGPCAGGCCVGAGLKVCVAGGAGGGVCAAGGLGGGVCVAGALAAGGDVCAAGALVGGACFASCAALLTMPTLNNAATTHTAEGTPSTLLENLILIGPSF